MKKGLKIFGAVAGVAALAALLPYSVKKDEELDETTASALLWKYTNRPDREVPGERKVTVDIGFTHPFKTVGADVFADDEEVVLVDSDEDAPQCDIELTLEPDLEDQEFSDCTPEA